MADVAQNTKQDDTLLAVIATIPLLGLIMFFGMNDLSDFARHYAKQGTGLFILWVIAFVLGIIPILGWLLSCLLSLIALVGWLLLVINALQGNRFELPVLTDLVNQLLSSQKK